MHGKAVSMIDLYKIDIVLIITN